MVGVVNAGDRLEFVILPDILVMFVALDILLAFRNIVLPWIVGVIVRIRVEAIEVGPEKEVVVRERCFGL